MSSINLKIEEPVETLKSDKKGLADSVENAMENYFQDLDGHDVTDLHALFLEEVEKPFFEVVMKHTKGNITHAAQILGLNRVTLRNRLKKYSLD